MNERRETDFFDMAFTLSQARYTGGMPRVLLPTLCLLLAWSLLTRAEVPAAQRAKALAEIDSNATHYGEISRRIWEFSEVGYKETKSAALLRAELEKAGFKIQDNVGGIPTAFTATWGQGKPVIGIMGEYDALPGLSQDTVPTQKPRVAGDPGHGCGHNLFGTAAAAAAIAVKHHLESNHLPGTLRFYGTPAEEGGGGKIYMARAGVFADVDTVITWHPGSSNAASKGSSLANINAKFRFYGKAAHAAAAPWAGRSALDALLLMAHAVDMLREHVTPATRIHYVITNGGGAPNVVPAFAEGYFYARHPNMPELDAIWTRILKTGEGAAIATETRLEVQLVNSVYNVLPNYPLADLLQANLKTVGGIHYTPEEKAFAEELRKSFDPLNLPPLGSEELVLEPETRLDSLGGSTDVGDISWLVPTAQFTTATFVPGTPGHSWQSTACAGMSIGRKGMIVAAKTLTLSAMDLFSSPTLIDAAKSDFARRRAGFEYHSRVPADARPPLNYRDK